MHIGHISVEGRAWLAPMAGITDMPFRHLCKRMGAALTVTEMVSVRGLFYNAESAMDLRAVSPLERPVGLQLFGCEPQMLADMALRYGRGFDFIDLNMGCPAPKIVKANQGSALMRDIGLASSMVEALAKTVSQPVTVKFRKGWDERSINAVEFGRAMEDHGAAAITVHGRTRDQFYAGRADWDIIGMVKAAVRIPVIGNGDIMKPEDAALMLSSTHCDAVMVGRGAQGNPWIFRRINHYLITGELLPEPDAYERIRVAIEHARMLVELRGEHVAVPALRKHMAWYLHGLRDAALIRKKVFECRTLQALEETMMGALANQQ